MIWRILGPIEAATNSQVIHIPRPQQRAVLAFLLINANLVVSTQQLAHALWGDNAPATARSQIHSCVSQIRRALHGSNLDRSLTSETGGYRVTVASGELDLAEFTTRVVAARTDLATNTSLVTAGQLRDALALWRGTPLTGASGAFVEAAVAGLNEKRLAACEDLADAELALGNHSQLVEWLSGIVDSHPHRERMVGQLMLALAGRGQQSDALSLYALTRTRLANDLGMEPGTALAEAHLRVLRQQVPMTTRIRQSGQACGLCGSWVVDQTRHVRWHSTMERSTSA
jgi:DNA-binding SARP family transcriptional activator